MLNRAPCHCNGLLQNSTHVAQILYQHVHVCRHSYIQASWDMCSIGGLHLNNVCAFCMHLRATVVQHLLGKCHSPLHSSCLIKVTLACKVPKETVRLPAEQAAQEQSTKHLPKLRILSWQPSSFFKSRGTANKECICLCGAHRGCCLKTWQPNVFWWGEKSHGELNRTEMACNEPMDRGDVGRENLDRM